MNSRNHWAAELLQVQPPNSRSGELEALARHNRPSESSPAFSRKEIKQYRQKITRGWEPKRSVCNSSRADQSRRSRPRSQAAISGRKGSTLGACGARRFTFQSNIHGAGAPADNESDPFVPLASLLLCSPRCGASLWSRVASTLLAAFRDWRDGQSQGRGPAPGPMAVRVTTRGNDFRRSQPFFAFGPAARASLLCGDRAARNARQSIEQHASSWPLF